MSEARAILPGSHRDAAPGAEKIGPADPSEQTHVTVYVRGKDNPLPITQPGHFITREEYAATYGASESDFDAIRDFAKQYNLTPSNENPATRSIQLSGAVADLSRAFGVSLDHVKIKGRVYRHRTGSVSVPQSLLPIVTAVVGLDNRPQAKPHVRAIHPRTVSEALTATTFSPLTIGQLYDFPAGLDGTGTTIAVIELGGGYLQSDMDAYFSSLGLQTPSITVASVDGGQNSISAGPDPDDSDLEVALDIQVAGALAPGAKQVVYFAAGGDQGFLDAINNAITATPQPAVISISWGGPEANFSGQARQQFESALQHAAQLGIPVTVASGDDGSFDGTGALAVDFPSSATHALGCGGTNLLASGAAIGSETVWNSLTTDANGNPVRIGTGGGVSVFFPRPDYQSSINVPAPAAGTAGGRGVPDVAGDADPETGYNIFCKGKGRTAGGTSAVAPLWAALIARCAQKLCQPVGFLQPLLYQSGVSGSSFNDITQGDNDSNGQGGLYHAGPGWDACTGLGSPKGSVLLQALLNAAAQGSSSDEAPAATPAVAAG
jgi:kumamolisin